MMVRMVAATTTPNTRNSLLVVSQRRSAAVRLLPRGSGRTAGCGRRVARAREMALCLRLLFCVILGCF
ncbi:MAG: hypothetical protein ACUVWR_06535 [Anaerolineae bacterium]